jgi:ABC-type transport system involved in multi-copper enzyme maturation permease subunit
MKLREIFRFEFAYQIHRPWPWLSFAILVVFAFQNTRVGIVPVTLPQDFILNSPFIIAAVSVFSCLIWLLIAPAIAGEAAARDVHTRMHPLTYTAPVSKAEYLGGRFLAALVLNALILLGVQVGSLLAAYAPGVDPEIIGPFRPAAYLAAYALIGLPNAFIATTIQFSSALLSGRAMASYLGSLLILFLSYPVSIIVSYPLALPALGKMTDPIGAIAIMNAMMSEWTIVEKNIRMFGLEGPMLWNRLLWLGIALATLAFIHLRFRLAHRAANTGLWSRLTRRFAAKSPAPADTAPMAGAISTPQIRQTFGLATHVRQTLAIAWSSFWMIAKSPAGLFLLLAFPMFLVLLVQIESQHWDVPLLPRTGYVLAKHFTAPLAYAYDYRVIVPLLILFYAGQLVWRERDAGLSENIDATSVPEWVLLLGKFLGLSIVLIVLMAFMMAAGMLAQLLMGFHEFQLGLYLQILFGLQLPEYLLFAALALVVQAVVNQKHLGMLVALLAYLCVIFSPMLGIEHNLLIFGSSPAWSYTDMRGFGTSLGPWLWFKLYWAAWALLLAVVARLLWVRGKEPGFRARLQLARRRFTRATAGAAIVAAGLILTLGGFIFYNTNVLNQYRSSSESVERRAEYERRYGQYGSIPQPQLAGTNLQIEIYPARGAATIQGTYRLVNRDTVPIESVHLATASSVETRELAFDRPARRVLADGDLGHSIYALAKPLQPGDSLTLSFEVRFEPRGFSNSGGSDAVVANGTHFTGAALPAIGYQPGRELTSPDDRRAQGLPRQVTFPTPDDVDPNVAAGTRAVFEAVVSTDEDQVAVAPGALRRTWMERGRRYFHYASDVPIGGQYVFFSANYAVHHEQWNDVDIWFFHHPRDTKNLDRMIRSARASLDYYTAQFGPYPYRFLQFVEQPALGMGMGVDGSGVITGLEGFFLLNPQDDGIDVVFEVVAHEMAHQWWGVQLQHAPAEGAIVLSEGLAWYSGMQVVEKAAGREQLRRFMRFMREPYPWPPIRTGLPLLRAMDPYAGYRKGPFALYALSQYIGEERVNAALRSLLQKKAGVAPSLATTLDLYQELQAVTPESLQPLLHDLFEVNTFWTFDTKQATAVQTQAGTWQVTLDVEARKVVADSAGVETDMPINELVEIGIFAPAEPGEVLGRSLYLQKHPIRSGRQTITVIVPHKPARAGIDPYNLLDWEEGDNIEPIELDGSE